jgi:hypothetical protein
VLKAEKSIQKRDDKEKTILRVHFVDRNGYLKNKERTGPSSIIN